MPGFAVHAEASDAKVALLSRSRSMKPSQGEGGERKDFYRTRNRKRPKRKREGVKDSRSRQKPGKRVS